MALFDGLRRMFGSGPALGSGADDPSERAGLPRVATTIVSRDPVEEVRSAIDRVAQRLEARSAQEEAALGEMRTALEPLERIGDSLGELRRTSMTLNETLAEHADAARRAAEGTQSILERVGDSLVSQVDMVGSMQQQVDGLVRSFGSLGEDLDRLRSSLSQIAEHSGRSAGSLAELVQDQARREADLVREIRGFRNVISILLVLVVMGVIAIAVGGVLLFRSLT